MLRATKSFIFGLFLACLASGSAWSAEFRVFSPSGVDLSMIFVKGRIERGDAKRFSEILDGLPRPKASISLDSPGGFVTEALDIGS